MLAASLIVKKRDGLALADEEIRWLIEGYCSGSVADYQMSALAMAICLRGMSDRETATLTHAMLESGDRFARAAGDGRLRLDKHSTGGLGDKVSLILAPLLAACGVAVPMISGRGLGLTGGTLDKLESIDGFQTQLSASQANAVLQRAGVFIVGATQSIAPADRQLYALRDVTGTVESVALITASILSKKLAASLDALIMDVKVGSGGFMKSESKALELARSLTRVGDRAGLPTTALLSDMEQPLGYAVGNAVEVNEALEVLGGASGVTRELTVELGARILVRVGRFQNTPAATSQLHRALDRGDARECFDKMVHAQGGRLREPLPLAPDHTLTASRSGYLANIDCRVLGEVVLSLGGGRRKKGDVIDHRVGLRMHARIGDLVSVGDPLITLYGPKSEFPGYAERLSAALQIVEEPIAKRPLILDCVDSQGDLDV